MPAGEIAFELLGGLLRWIGYFVAETLFEVLIKGLGYLIWKPFLRNVDPNGALAVFTGILAWLLIGFGGYWLYDYISVKLFIDRCLDSGGQYDYQYQSCIGAKSN